MKWLLMFGAAGVCLLCACDAQGQCRGGGGSQGMTAGSAASSGSSSVGFGSYGYNLTSANPMQQQALAQIQAYAQLRAVQEAQREQRNQERRARQISTYTQRRLQEEARRQERREFLTASLSSQ